MIGFFIFDELPTVDVVSVLCHAKSNSEIKGYFYVRQTDCHDVSSVQVGDEFFGALDDATGYGACIYVVGLSSETDALYATKNLKVDGNAAIDGNATIHGNAAIDGIATIHGNAAIDGSATIRGIVTIERNTIMSGDVRVNRKLNVFGNMQSYSYIGGRVIANITLTPVQAAAIVAAATATDPTTIPNVNMRFILPA